MNKLDFHPNFRFLLIQNIIQTYHVNNIPKLTNKLHKLANFFSNVVGRVIHKGESYDRVKKFQMMILKIVKFVRLDFPVQELVLFLDDSEENVVLVGC